MANIGASGTLLISLGILAYLFWHYDFSEIVQNIRTIEVRTLLLVFVCLFLNVQLTSLRLWALLQAFSQPVRPSAVARSNVLGQVAGSVMF